MVGRTFELRMVRLPTKGENSEKSSWLSRQGLVYAGNEPPPVSLAVQVRNCIEI